MIKRILVALDPDDDTPVATQYAIQLARKFDASLTGLAVVDTSNILTDIGTGGGVGAYYYSVDLWEELAEETRQVAVELLESFRQSCEKAGIRYRDIRKEGASEERIIEEMKYHDLLVVGRDSHFFYNQPTRDTQTLARIVKNGVAPTLVVTDEYRNVEKILIAFDGSSPASRTLKGFVQLLPYGKDLDIELVFVSESDEKEEVEKSSFILHLAEEYLKSHNFHYIVKTVLETGQPATRILERQKKSNPDLVLLGAHSVSAIRRIAFGSVTHELIAKTKGSLFLSP
ncbi:MAG: universal stress protein [Balneolaceae bacterium]